ncbi:uncharacterized protein KGF55_000876 [Candida pseudojiufengensis]|uniref:uncharacterized protein n=1 Tax=Candida pseudojiufengensis TaxID=497109 RepID=UPI002224CD08|nr:uncharacterized protein KGF55_000876 [Candida pseudojiufengensis]KAI5966567.1 hypothetical protein KGF55_000876 [Candida pseudojiufengensis]
MGLNIFQKKPTEANDNNLASYNISSPKLLNYNYDEIEQTPPTTSRPLLPTSDSYHVQFKVNNGKSQSQQESTKLIDPTRSRTYKSQRINLPNSSNGSNSPNSILTPPQTSTSNFTEPVNNRTSATKRNRSPNTPNSSKMSNASHMNKSSDSLNQIRARRMNASKKPKQRTVNNSRNGKGRPIRRRNSMASSKDSLILMKKLTNESNTRTKGSKPIINDRSLQSDISSKPIAKSKPSNNGNRKHKRDRTSDPKFKTPYPINDEIISIIITDEVDEEGANVEDYEEIEDEEFPVGFEPVIARKSQSPQLVKIETSHASNNNQQSATPTVGASENVNNARLLSRQNTLRQLTSSSQPHEGPSSSSPQLNSGLYNRRQDTTTTSIYSSSTDEPQIDREQAVACILERTGSTAQNGRRGRRNPESKRNPRLRNQVSTSSNMNMSRGGTIDENLESHEPQTESIRRSSITSTTPTFHTTFSSIPESSTSSTALTSTTISHTIRMQQTRSAIIERLNRRIDPTSYSSTEITSTIREEDQPPPLDEYAYSHQQFENSPPYREKLHKRIDLLSFDPRYHVPVLRINKKLIKNSQNLKKTIRKLIKLHCIPTEINIWEITKIDDLKFYQILPSLIMEVNEQDNAIEQIRIQEEREAQQREYEAELQRAIAISMEEQSQRQLFKGFRYKSSNNEEPQEVRESSNEIDNVNRHDLPPQEDEFINVDEAVSVWQRQQRQNRHQQEVSSQQQQQQQQQQQNQLRVPGSFNYLLPAHANSSASSYMTAY